MTPISEREFTAAVDRIEEAVERGMLRLEETMKGFDTRLRQTERSTTVQMWFWRITGGTLVIIVTAVLASWTK